MREPIMPTEQRAELCSATVTLDGLPARITGYRNDYATVRQVGSGVSAEWAWVTVARIVGNGGEFQS